MFKHLNHFATDFSNGGVEGATTITVICMQSRIAMLGLRLKGSKEYGTLSDDGNVFNEIKYV